MKIVFITPAPVLRRIPVYRLGGRIYGRQNAITGPLILGGILKKAGHDVELYEEMYRTPNYRKLMKDTDVFCISVMTSNAPRGYELADMIHRCSSARVIMGGVHATFLTHEVAAHADQTITGEGEDTILDVVEGRITDRIVYGQPHMDLDELPFPDYSILKTPCSAANVITTRGCHFRCTFCSTSRMFVPYRQRSVDNVIEEIRMYKEMGFKYINIEDDNFIAEKERAKEICRRMIDEGLIFKEIFFFGRTDIGNDDELLDLLEKAHFNRVLIGIESLNQEALDSIHKGQDIHDIINAAEACKKHKIRLIASIVLGLDEDSDEDMKRATQFAKDIDAYEFQPAVLTPFPGTPVYDKLMQEDRMLPGSWSRFDMMNVTFQPKNLSPWDLQSRFYDAACDFYDFRSIPDIVKLFGLNSGMRRLGLSLSSKLGAWGARFTASHFSQTSYGQLLNAPWSFDKKNIPHENIPDDIPARKEIRNKFRDRMRTDHMAIKKRHAELKRAQ